MFRQTSSFARLRVFAAAAALALPFAVQAANNEPQSAEQLADEYNYAMATDPGMIFLQVGDVDPLKDAFQFNPAVPQTAERSASGRDYFLVQFNEALSVEKLNALKADGWEFLNYVPNNAYIVRLEGARSTSQIEGNTDIRWSSRYHGGFKVSPELLAGTTPATQLTVVIDVWPGEDRKDLASKLIENHGITVLRAPDYVSFPRLYVSIQASQVAEIAGYNEVRYLSRMLEAQLRNDSATGVCQSGVAGPAAGTRTIWDKGLHGEGQVIGHIDGKITQTSCYITDTNPIGPTHRKLVYYGGSAGSDSHGVHTAATSAGKNSSGSLTNAGHAYEAKIAHSTIPSETTNALENLLTTHRNNGARVHTNSWGNDGTTSYTIWCNDIDDYTWNNEDDLVIFAVTNTSTLKTPENSKNVLAVGATNKPNFNNHGSGGTGPTSGTNARRKPEIYAPGVSTVSASTAACGTTSSTGTSMACPAITGCAALVRQYFTDGYFPTGAAVPGDSYTPTGSLIKAMLLNGTVDMTGIAGYPSNQEGWGRLLLDNVLFFSGETRRLWWVDKKKALAQGIAQGSTDTYTLSISSTSEPLKVTMVWNDPPAAVGASFPMINNLDLEVQSPSGSIYRGNVFSGGVSTTGGTADINNNVEMVLVNSPEVGAWTVRVIGTTVNALYSPLPYSAVAAANIVPGNRGALGLGASTYSCSGLAALTLIDGNGPVGSASVTLSSTSGDTQAFTLTETSTSVYSGNAQLGSGAPVAADGILQVAHGDTVTVSYSDADTGSGPETIQTTFTLDCVGATLGGVAFTNITDTTARMTFTSNEAITGNGQAALTCGGTTHTGAITFVAPGSYRADFTGLTPGTTYRARINANDSVGNNSVEDNGGACHPFTTMLRQTDLLADFQDAGAPGTGSADGFTVVTPVSAVQWTLGTNANAHSPNHAFAVTDHTAAQDSQLTSPSFAVDPAGGVMTFWHTFNFETNWDGGVLEYRLNGAGSWLDAGSLITTGGYNATLNTSASNPLSGRPAWSSGTIGAMTQVSVNLNSLAGNNVQFRWRIGADSIIGATGWVVDDIEVFRFVAPTSTVGGQWESLK